ncbi:LysR family transcriptional regulator [Mycoplana sp. MJR14]|uniref:LysR family transcriptional regulator n=1 Tax=Mycoplana sp. MJR14 TaxID=3032583 RepID=UPI000DD64566|nr:LysR family transcriptional regulator [Mycoplana sp. MJR14]MDF1631680.1 LysR family transcriptional regulator [Mycoplana sp. MJR14]
MDLYQAMATFVRVVETGSFSAAARHLGVGQPSVSKTIAQLEDWLKVALLIRSTRRLTPTEAGHRFYERACAAIEEADEAVLAARGAGAGLAGRLRISAATTFARLHIVPLLPEFLAQHPALEIDVVLDDRVIDHVAEGIDLSFRMGPMPDSSAVARKIARGHLCVVATPAYFDRMGRPQHPADLAAHEMIVYTQLPTTWSFERGGAQTSIVATGRLRMSAAEGAREAVLAHMGPTIGSTWMFSPELASGAVEQVLAEWSIRDVDVWAVFPVGRMPTAKARQFAAFIEAALGRSR